MRLFSLSNGGFRLIASIFLIAPIASAEEEALPSYLNGCEFGETVNVLQFQDLLIDSKDDQWSMMDGQLKSTTKALTTLYVPYSFPDRYVIRATLRRDSGRACFGIGFPMGTNSTSLILDGWNGRIAGLHMIDHLEANNKQSEGGIEQSLFTNGTPREVLIAVLSHQIVVLIDGKELIRWKGHPSRLSTNYQTNTAKDLQLSLYNSRSSWTISRLEITPVKTVPGEPPPKYSDYVELSPARDKLIRAIVERKKTPRLLIDVPDHALYLDLHEQSPRLNYGLRGSLLRELSRQALLLTAREEFGMSTRDWAVRENFPFINSPGAPNSGRHSEPLSVVTTVSAEGLAEVTVFREGYRKYFKPLWHGEQQISVDTPYSDLARWLEELSREKFSDVVSHEFESAPTERQWDDRKSVPEEIEQQLRSWNVFAQFLGLRRLHAAIHESGESPQRLAALSQAYARLGLMTSNYYGTFSKVYHARALIYAERMLAKTGESAESLWNRAYVRALVGLPREAQQDLARAKNATGNGPTPHWSRDLETYCQGDVQQLRQRLYEADADAFVAFLYWKLQSRRASDSFQFEAYTHLIEKEPESLHALFLTARFTRSLGAKRVALQTAEFLPQVLTRNLPELPELPDQLRTRLESGNSLQFTDLPEVVRLLKAAGSPKLDRGEPSLDSFGQLIQEATFLTIWQVLDFEKNWLAIPVSDRSDHFAEMLEGHPAQSMIKSIGKKNEEWKKPAEAFMNQIDVERMEESCRSQLNLFRGTYGLIESAKEAVVEHRDLTDSDLNSSLGDLGSNSRKLRQLSELEKVAPNHPLTIEWRLRLAPGSCAQEIKHWEQQFELDISMQEMLAGYYSNLGQLDDAERCVKRWIDLNPSHSSYLQLAEIAKLRSDDEGWLRASLESLEYPVPGLEHGQTNKNLAQYYLDRNQPLKAQPFAEAAAQTGAAWAYFTAADVQEELGNFETADAFHQRISGRYTKGLNWFLFRLRTGYGDFEEAGRYAMEQYGDRQSDYAAYSFDNFQLGYLFLLMGEEDRGYEQLVRISRAGYSPYYFWHAFSLAVAHGDAEVRDEMLKLIASRKHRGDTDSALDGSHRIASHLLQRFEEGRPDEFDLDWIDGEILSLPEGGPTTMWFVLGTYLGKYGREEEAEYYLRLAATSNLKYKLDSILAAFLLRQHETELPPRRERDHIPLRSPRNASGAIVMNHPAPVGFARFGGDGTTVVTVDETQTCRVWNGSDAETRDRFESGDIVRRLSTDARYLVLARTRARTFEVRTLDPPHETWKSFPSREGVPIFGRIGLESSNVFLGISRKVNRSIDPFDVLQAWDLSTPESRWTYDLEGKQVYVLQPEADEKHLWLLLRKQSDNSTFVERLSLHDGRVVETRELPGYSTNVARLTPDGSTMVTQSIQGEIRIWDVETWSNGLRFWRPMVSELAISPDRSLVAFGYPSGELEICDIVKRKVVLHLHEHVRSITSLQFSPDGQELCTSSLDFTTRKWKLSELLAWAENRSAGENALRVEFTNSLQMQFSPIPQGDFLMGMREGLRTSRFFHPVFELETPRHEVRITRPFYLARHEVTVGQFREFVNATGYVTEVEKSEQGGSHVPFGKYVYEQSPEWTWKTPPFEQTDDHPVVLVSWNDAQAFCKWLSENENRVYRLPTEAEWEYACRAGTATSWYTGNTFASLEGHVNTADMLYAEAYHTRLDGKLPDDGYVFTAPVGSYRSNGFGLFDMSGNVYEWCQDFNDRKRYEKNPRVDPTGPKNGKARVIRGGSFVVPAMHARSAKRDDFSHMPDEGWSTTGFRVLMEIKADETLPDSIIPDAD